MANVRVPFHTVKRAGSDATDWRLVDRNFRELEQAFAQLASANAGALPKILADNPWVYWPCQDLPGTIGLQEVIRGLNAIANGNTKTGVSGPRTQKAVAFDGTSTTFLKCPGDITYPGLDPIGTGINWSAECWVQLNDLTLARPIAGIHGFSGHHTGWRLAKFGGPPGHLSASIEAGGTYNDVGAGALDTAWHHLVGTFSVQPAVPQVVVQMYFDGTLNASSTIAGTYTEPVTSDQPVFAEDDTFGAALNGNLAHIAFYKYILSAAQVTAHFNAF